MYTSIIHACTCTCMHAEPEFVENIVDKVFPFHHVHVGSGADPGFKKRGVQYI